MTTAMTSRWLPRITCMGNGNRQLALFLFPSSLPSSLCLSLSVSLYLPLPRQESASEVPPSARSLQGCKLGATLGCPPQLSLTLQALPYSLLALAMAMYLPVLLWQYAAVPALSSDLLFIISELDKSYNRAIRLVQHMLKIRQESSDPDVFWDELEK